MISIKKLKAGDTVHIILQNGFPLELITYSPNNHKWEIVSRPGGRRQSQATTTSFLGSVLKNDLALATLHVQGSSGADSRLTKGTVKGSGPTVVAEAQIPWGYIKAGWKLTREAVEMHDPIIPSRPAFGTNVLRHKIKIP